MHTESFQSTENAFIVKLSGHATGYMEHTQLQTTQYLLLVFNLKKSFA